MEQLWDGVDPQWEQQFTAIPHEIMLHHIPAMGMYGFGVYAALCSFARWKSKFAFPGSIAIARRLGCSERHVRTELEKLERLGFIKWVPRVSKSIRGRWQIFDTPRIGDTKAADENAKPADDAAKPADDDTPLMNQRNQENQSSPQLVSDEPRVTRKTPLNPVTRMEPIKPVEPEVPPQPKVTARRVPKSQDPDRPKPSEAKVPSLQPAIVALIDELWERTNGVDCAWDGVAFVRLKTAMVARSRWTLEQWFACIRNWFASGVNLALPPADFVAQLPKYLSGPLDKYGKPMEIGNAAPQRNQPQSKTERAYAAILEADRLAGFQT